MATTIKFKRGTRANLDSLASSNSLEAGEPILITDEDRIAVCTSDSTYEEFAKVSEVVASGMTNPMTTAGDTIYGGTSGVPTRRAKGTDGDVYTMVSGLPAWATPTPGGDELEFSVPPRIENTSGSETLYNPAQRTFYLLDITNSNSTYTVTISRKPSSGGTAAFTNVEHYVLIRNTAAAAKTLVVQLETTGDKMDSEGLSAVAIPANGIYEVGYIWVARGTDNLCIITKSTLLYEITK